MHSSFRVPLCLFALVSLIQAQIQPPTNGKDKDRQQSNLAPPETSGNQSSALEGTIRADGGTPIIGANVSVNSASNRDQRIASTDQKGHYELRGLQPDTYSIRFDAPGFNTRDQSGVVLKGGDHLVRDVALTPEVDTTVRSDLSMRTRMLVGAFLVFLYLVSVLLTRWFKIALPSQNFLCGQIDAVGSRLVTEVNPIASDDDIKRIESLKRQLPDIKSQYLKADWSQFFFWSQSRENASWVAIHEIERELVAYLSPPDLVHTHLIVAVARLRTLPGLSAKALADQIDHELIASSPNMDYRRVLLASATELIYEDRDTTFTTLMDWQNKAMWLILIASMIMVVVGALGGNVMLFLSGAAGGLVSRLMRTIQRQDVPIDYGASWTTLFLSPLFGAFSAWFGIALIVLLADPGVSILGNVFKLVSWGDPVKVSTMAVAFALGFSERLFISLVDVLEKQAVKAEPAKGSPQQAAPLPAPVPFDEARKKATEAANGDDTAMQKLVTFLQAMDEPVEQVSRDAIKQKLDYITKKAAASVPLQAKYVEQAKKAGL